MSIKTFLPTLYQLSLLRQCEFGKSHHVRNLIPLSQPHCYEKIFYFICLSTLCECIAGLVLLRYSSPRTRQECPLLTFRALLSLTSCHASTRARGRTLKSSKRSRPRRRHGIGRGIRPWFENILFNAYSPSCRSNGKSSKQSLPRRRHAMGRVVRPWLENILFNAYSLSRRSNGKSAK